MTREPNAATPPPAPTRTAVGGAGLSPGELLAGRYRILELLGVGGMGVVYRALDQTLGLEVALKVLRPEISMHGELRDRFRSEILLARQVTHRNVVRIHDISSDGELVFLTMDLVNGRSLADILDAEGKFSTERALAVAGELAAALAAAHDEGIVHRDLKPANILIDANGRALITDFGVARSLAEAGSTVAGKVVGTLAYMSPEQALGQPVDGRSDLYALGLVLFEMLTGSTPFPGGSAAEITAQRVAGDPKDLRDLDPALPPALARLVARCLERRPARRYADARALIADLERGGASFSAKPRRRLALLAAAVVLAVLTASALLRTRSPAPAGGAAATTAPNALHAVAILPFVEETGRSDLAWAKRGLPELLAASLGERPQLRVIDPLRVERLLLDLHWESGALAESQLATLAELVNADRLVTGVLRASGTQLRLEMRLRAAGAGGSSETFADQPTSEELFAAAERLGARVADRLAGAEASGSAPGERLEASPAALAAYAEGAAELAAGASLASIPAFERAVARSPGFSLAWLRLAEAYDDAGRAAKARAAIARAIAETSDPASRTAVRARAFAALLAGEPGSSAELLTNLLARFPHDGEARIALAEARGRQGDIASAVAELSKVVERDPQHPRAWFLLGKWLIRGGESRRAVDEVLVRGLVVQNRLQSEQGKSEVLNAMGVAHQELGELDRAEALYREAAALRERQSDRRGLATSTKNLATLSLIRGDLEAAEAQYATALDLFTRTGDPAGIAEVENALGGLAEERGLYPAALEHFRRALQLRRELGDALSVAQSLDNVGFASFAIGDLDHATTYWQQSRDAWHASGDRAGEIFASENLARLDLLRGRWPAARKALLESLAASRELSLRDAEAAALAGLGRLAFLEGEFAAALGSFSEAAAIAAALGDQRGEIDFALDAAEVRLAQGADAAAEADLDRVDAALAGGASAEQSAARDLLRGILACRRGDPREAAARFVSAEREAEASGTRRAVAAARLSASMSCGPSKGESAGGEVEAISRLASEAERLGDQPLRLRALEELARAALAAGSPEVAERAAAESLDLAASCGGPWWRSFRLHGLRARALEALGRSDEARASAASARAELLRLTRNMTVTERNQFRSLAEVRDIESLATAG